MKFIYNSEVFYSQLGEVLLSDPSLPHTPAHMPSLLHLGDSDLLRLLGSSSEIHTGATTQPRPTRQLFAIFPRSQCKAAN